MSNLVKMPRLHYPNPNEAFKLFTNASKHSYSGILHQEEIPNEANAVPSLVPIAYFSGSFSKTQQLWSTTQKECYAQSIGQFKRFSFYLPGTKCTLYCDHKPLAPCFTTGISSLVLDCWTLELQRFDIQFGNILGKKNVVADVISKLRTLGIYLDNGNDDLAKMDDNVVDSIMDEAHAIEWVPNSAIYTMEKLNLDILGEEQWQDTFAWKKVKTLRT